MPMPASVLGDISMGHTGFSPSPITPSGSINSVLISNLIPHGVGDLIAIHILGNSAHVGNIGAGSSSVLANNIPVARLMDKGTCGAVLMGSVGNVLIGG